MHTVVLWQLRDSPPLQGIPFLEMEQHSILHHTQATSNSSTGPGQLKTGSSCFPEASCEPGLTIQARTGKRLAVQSRHLSYIYTYVHIHTYNLSFTYMHIYTYMCTYTCMHTYIYMCIYTSVYIYTYMKLKVHINAYRLLEPQVRLFNRLIDWQVSLFYQLFILARTL